MSVTHPARGLLTRRLVLRSNPSIQNAPEAVHQHQHPAPASRCRNFHTSPAHLKRRKRFSSVKAEELGLVSPKAVKDFTNRHFPQYTKEDKEVLATHYTPEQMAAIEAGEKAVSTEDLALQGRLRIGTYVIPYMDDFATIRPSIDKRAPDPGAEDPDPFARFLTAPEFHEDFFRWLEGFKPKDGEVDFTKLSDHEAEAALEKYIPTEEDLADFMLNRSAMTDRNRYKRTESAFASALPDKVPGVAGLYPKTNEGNDEIMDAVVAKSGWDEGLLKHAKLKIVETKTVHNQTRLGKVRSMRITIAAGNGDGWIGVATTKGLDMEEVIKKARTRAYLSMRPIRRYENRTIYGNVTGKVGGTVIEMFTRPPGFGNRAPSLVHELLRLAGIKDISTRMPRGRNKMNLARAVIEALHNQKDPEVIAQGLGRKLVDVRKVYYGGLVY